MTTAESFRARLLARQTLVGTFLKTPTGHGVEIIGDAGFDFVVIDQEHAPFDRSSTDVALAIKAARTGAPWAPLQPGRRCAASCGGRAPRFLMGWP